MHECESIYQDAVGRSFYKLLVYDDAGNIVEDKTIPLEELLESNASKSNPWDLIRYLPRNPQQPVSTYIKNRKARLEYAKIQDYEDII